MPILFQLHLWGWGRGVLGSMFDKAICINSCKCTAFDSHKMWMLALLGLFTKHNDRFP